MAHDFDNVLTGILGFAELAQLLLGEGTPESHYISELLNAVQRGTSLTQEFHQLSRSGVANPRPTRLQDFWRFEAGQMRSSAGPMIELVEDVPESLPPLAIDAEPLKVALGHLLSNAREAMPAGGTLTISAVEVELRAAEARRLFGSPPAGEYVRIDVCDTGIGIEPELRRKLFSQPFVTTKARHRGLGLAVAYRIVQAHGGGLRLEPNEPHGTVALAFFPVVRSSPGMAPSGPISLSSGVSPS
jgi:signal transduction histidine kinase